MIRGRGLAFCYLSFNVWCNCNQIRHDHWCVTLSGGGDTHVYTEYIDQECCCHGRVKPPIYVHDAKNKVLQRLEGQAVFPVSNPLPSPACQAVGTVNSQPLPLEAEDPRSVARVSHRAKPSEPRFCLPERQYLYL